MYRFGRQQRPVIDPSSQTEDLGDDAVKASNYGIANLKRIVPKLIDWTYEEGKNYDDLSTLYDQVFSQFNRYMGHVRSNIGGVYQYNKTYDQEGAVFTHVSKIVKAIVWRFYTNNSLLLLTGCWIKISYLRLKQQEV